MMGGTGGRRGGGLFGMGETTAKLINPSEIGVQFRLIFLVYFIVQKIMS